VFMGVSFGILKGQQYGETGYGTRTDGNISYNGAPAGDPLPNFVTTASAGNDVYNIGSVIMYGFAMACFAASFFMWCAEWVAAWRTGTSYYDNTLAFTGMIFWANGSGTFWLLIAMATAPSTTYNAAVDNDYYNVYHNQIPGSASRVNGVTAYTPWTWSLAYGNPSVYMNLWFAAALIVLAGLLVLALPVGLLVKVNWGTDLGGVGYDYFKRLNIAVAVVEYFILMCFGYDIWRFAGVTAFTFVYDIAAASMAFYIASGIAGVVMFGFILNKAFNETGWQSWNGLFENGA